MNETTILAIMRGIELVATVIVPSIEYAMRLKRLAELDPDVTVNVRNLTGEAIAIDEAVIARADAWLKERGLD